jgi:hypothetical protein
LQDVSEETTDNDKQGKGGNKEKQRMSERGSAYQEKREIVFEGGGCKGDKFRFYPGISVINNGKTWIARFKGRRTITR